MEGVNGVIQRPRRKEVDDNGAPQSSSSKVDYHLNNLLASHLSKPDLTPQEIAEASKANAAAAALAAKAARATAFEKAAKAAKAVAAAKSALELIASFPNHVHVASDLSTIPSKLQLGDVNVSHSQGIISHSSSNCENKNDQCEVPIDTEQARVEVNGVGMEIDSDRLIVSAAGEEAKEGTQVSRKRGRPKSK